MSQICYVSYARVSTERQGRSGLGLEAQRIAVQQFLNGSQGKLLAEFTEIETGLRRDRPELQAALELCRRSRATLVIAKLDRLARNVAFISSLLESRVRFIALDMPEADVTFLQMAAVFGEWEARKVSERTKAALAAAKARGTVLGWACPTRQDEQRDASRRGVVAIQDRAALFAANTLPIVESIQRSGIASLCGVAAALNARGIRTQRGRRWYPTTVRNLIERSRAN
jgi:DNA invertase Pin-like site-specific DNA recombinase